MLRLASLSALKRAPATSNLPVPAEPAAPSAAAAAAAAVAAAAVLNTGIVLSAAPELTSLLARQYSLSWVQVAHLDLWSLPLAAAPVLSPAECAQANALPAVQVRTGTATGLAGCRVLLLSLAACVLLLCIILQLLCQEQLANMGL